MKKISKQPPVEYFKAAKERTKVLNAKHKEPYTLQQKSPGEVSSNQSSGISPYM